MKDIKIYIGTDVDGSKIYWNPSEKTKEYHKPNGEIVVFGVKKMVRSPRYWIK